jgi:tRNA pseudouridine55 synthase
MATGLLVLVVGRATRLASYLTGHAKTYDALVRLGQATSTCDAEGEPIGEIAETLPDDGEVWTVLDSFVGTFAQLPPAHSAKKVGGIRAYRLARQNKPVELRPVDVTVHEILQMDRSGRDMRLRVTASAGFYVRSLARDIGERLGCGAHLAGLRRIRSGSFRVEDAVPLAEAISAGPGLATRLVPPSAALPEFAAVELTPDGLKRVLHGNSVSPGHFTGAWPPASGAPVRMLSGGHLVALGRPRGEALHPVVVLG